MYGLSDTASMVAPTSSLARVDIPTSSVMTSIVSPAPVVTTSVIPSPTPLSGEQDYFLCYAINLYFLIIEFTCPAFGTGMSFEVPGCSGK